MSEIRRNPKLTLARLREVLAYDPDTGLFTWLKPTANCRLYDRRAGCIVGSGYIEIRIDGVMYKAHRLAWLYMTGFWPELLIDHIDRRRTNNAWSNLRQTCTQGNARNVVSSGRNTSGIRNICKIENGKFWRAYLQMPDGSRLVTRHRTLDEATASLETMLVKREQMFLDSGKGRLIPPPPAQSPE